MRIISALFFVAGCTGLSLHSARSPAAFASRAAVTQHSRSLPARCAYNPDPMAKSRPKKVKSKQPKEKVKAPAVAVVPEQVFFEGPPSSTEMIIPGVSVITVVGIIPFAASVARQVWTRYKITNRRIEVASGFQGKEVVQATWREVTDVKWLRRFGGSAGDIVLTLKDGAKMEMRSVPEFDRNLAYMMEQLGEELQADCYYPDKPAKDFLAKVSSGEEPALTPAPAEAASEPAEVA